MSVYGMDEDMLKYYHTYDSRKCMEGEPDLKIMVLYLSILGDCRFDHIKHYYIEIKTPNYPKLTSKQQEMLDWINKSNEDHAQAHVVQSLDEFIDKTNNLGYPKYDMR